MTNVWFLIVLGLLIWIISGLDAVIKKLDKILQNMGVQE